MQAPPEPSCAICGRAELVNCPHEGERLQLALQQAQDRWSGVLRIREWVLNHARNHIIDTFEAARAARYATYLQYVQTFPYYSLYTYHKGRPPLPPAQVQYLRDQIWSADENLRLGVDTDWRNACLLYPETLDYYFRMVEIVFPKEKEELLRLDGGGGKKKGRRDSAVGDKGKRRS
ncbi:hypothetical protein Q7P36_002598 [Cladosporium allicinum]